MYPIDRCYFCGSGLKNLYGDSYTCSNEECNIDHQYSLFTSYDDNLKKVFVDCVSFMIDDTLVETIYSADGSPSYQKIFEHYEEEDNAGGGVLKNNTPVVITKQNINDVIERLKKLKVFR